MIKMHFIILGASVAGCTAAILLKQNGHDVTVYEQKSDEKTYKTLCTHFIQPIATSAIQALKIEDFFVDNSQKSLAKFYTSAGIIEPQSAYDSKSHSNIYAYNMERSTLDPFLKKLLKVNNINTYYNHTFKKIHFSENSCEVYFTNNDDPILCDYIIAADGRNSSVSKFLNIDNEESENDRATLFAYFENTPFDIHEHIYSHFATHEDEMGFIYPLKNNRVLLSWYFDKNITINNSDKLHLLISNIKKMFPQYSFDNLKLSSEIYGYKNLYKTPAHERALFVGDAAASLDPMSGVGCGFAFHSSFLLVKSFLESKDHDDFLKKYLDLYNTEIFPHFSGIIGDSKLSKNFDMKDKIYTQLIKDDELKRSYLNLTGRLIRPVNFQRSYIKSITQSPLKI